MPLPAKAPELNPVENIWQFLRENWISNRIFSSYGDIVRHITRRGSLSERRGLEDMTLGPTAYLAAKAKGDRSMPPRRRRAKELITLLRLDRRAAVRDGLSLQRCNRTSDTASYGGATAKGDKDVVARTFHAVGDGTSSHSRGRTRHLRRARHVQHHGNVGSPDAPRGAGRRSRRASEAGTAGRAAKGGRRRDHGRGGTRGAIRRNRPGTIRIAADTGEAGCSERRTPVRRGAGQGME